jgi:hypothetical protein
MKSLNEKYKKFLKFGSIFLHFCFLAASNFFPSRKLKMQRILILKIFLCTDVHIVINNKNQKTVNTVVEKYE